MKGSSVGIVEVFLVVATSTLFSIGGGNGPIAFMQDRWVSPGLLDQSLFAWAIALGHLTPGPNAGFLAGIGYYMYGLPGAITAAIADHDQVQWRSAALKIWQNLNCCAGIYLMSNVTQHCSEFISFAMILLKPARKDLVLCTLGC